MGVSGRQGVRTWRPAEGDKMGYRLVGIGVLCVLGLAGCAGDHVLSGNPSPSGETAVHQEELNLLCSSDQQCSDGHACTIDLCIAGICVHGPDLGCCETDDDCSTDVSCAAVSCVLNTCVETPILGCGDTEAASTTESDTSDDLLGVLCGSDTDCEDGDPCTDDVCLVGGVCLFASNPLCCEDANDCNGVLACHTGQCVDNRCSLTVTPGCEDDAGTTNDIAVSSEPAGTSQADTTSEPMTASSVDVTDEVVDTADPESTFPAPSGDATTSEGVPTDGDTAASDAPATSADTNAPAATSRAEATNSETFPAASSDGGTTSGDVPQVIKPTMGEPWKDPMPILTPFASGAESTDDSPSTADSVVDAGTVDTFDDPLTEVDVGDDEPGDDDHGTTGTALMTSRMTGGACTVNTRSGETASLAWICLGVIAGLVGRRRK